MGNELTSLLINDNGRIVYRSRYDISYQVGIFEDDQDIRSAPLSPIANTLVYSGVLKGRSGLGGGIGVTDETGQYSVSVIIPPCPGFSYSAGVPINAEVLLANFNPKAQDASPGVLPVNRIDYKFCSGFSAFPPGLNLAGLMAQVEAAAIEANLNTNTANFNLWLSTMQLNAIGVLPGIERTDTTEYQSDDSAIAYSSTHNFDFDGDGKIDTLYIDPNDPDTANIYLGGRSAFDELGNLRQPDIKRRRDRDLISQLAPQGLLKTISTDDLNNTDIYFYRAATNQLVGQIEGLAKPDNNDTSVIISGQNNASPLIYKGVHEDEPIATFGFSNLIVGAASFDSFSRIRAGSDDRRRLPWVPSERGAADFTSKNRPDFLRPGEEINIIAINRATGYIGSQRVRLKDVLNIPTEALKLYPPNLKIIATRTFEDEAGLSAKQQHADQLIGSEGAGLSSDQYVKIQTVWLANDGSVLPANLPGLHRQTGD